MCERIDYERCIKNRFQEPTYLDAAAFLQEISEFGCFTKIVRDTERLVIECLILLLKLTAKVGREVNKIDYCHMRTN